VFDVDGEIGRETLAQLERENSPLPWTVTATTGKGKHYFFQHDPRMWNRVSLGPGLDIRTDGGYVVAAPSEHLSGRVYKWEVSPEESDPAPWPEWLVLKLLALRDQKKNGVAPNLPPASLTPVLERIATSYTIKTINTCLAEMDAAYAPSGDQPGNRNETLNRNAFVLGQLAGRGEPIGNALELLKQIALSKGMDEVEVNEVSGRSFMSGQLKPKEIRMLDERERRGAERQAHTPEPTAPIATEPPAEPTPPIATPPARKKPKIQIVAGEIPRIVDEAEAALVSSGLPIYQRFGELVRVKRGERLSVDVLPEPQLLKVLALAANWEKWEKSAKAFVPANPSRDVVQVVATQGAYALPELLQIFDAPTVRQDGTVLQVAGYDAATRSIYAPRLSFPIVPDQPTRDDALAALKVLVDPLSDFPFKEGSDRSTVLALLLTVLGRPAIDGPTPLFVIRATDRGVGKSLLADVVNLIATGAPAARMTFADDPDEEGKRMVALGLESTPMALIDNVDRPLGGDVLAAATTAKTYKGRFLGQNRMVEVPVPVLVATGVNMSVRDDLGRRVLPIDMDPGVENPEERKGFKHPHLTAWVAQHRGELAIAALTILRAFFVAGKPEAVDASTFGSFESWSSIVRMALIWLGEADPCLGRAKLRSEGDVDRDAVLHFLQVWHNRNGAYGATVHEALEIARNRDNELLEAIASLDPKTSLDRLDSRRVSQCLQRISGRVVGGLRLERGQKTNRGVMWKAFEVSVMTHKDNVTSRHLSSPGPVTAQDQWDKDRE
jgi:hypothetical protein